MMLALLATLTLMWTPHNEAPDWGRNLDTTAVPSAHILPVDVDTAAASSAGLPSPPLLVAAPNDAVWGWIARIVLGQLIGFATRQVIERAFLAHRTGLAADNMCQISRSPGLSEQTRQDLLNSCSLFRQVAQTLRNTQLSQEQAIRQISRDLGALQATVAALQDRVDAIDRRLAAAEQAIYRLEQQQQEQLRMIVDLQMQQELTNRRVTAIEGQLVTLQGQVDQNTRDIAANRERIERESGRYTRHAASVAAAGYYSNYAQAGSAGGLGGGVTVNYNFTERFGMFATLAALPVESGAYATYDDEVWDTFGLFVGGLVNVLPPQFASLRLKVGAGVVHHLLSVSDPADPFSREETIDGDTNAALLADAEFGFSPPLFPVEFFVEAGVAALAVPLRDDAFFRVPAKALTFGGVGIRIPFTPSVRSN